MVVRRGNTLAIIIITVIAILLLVNFLPHMPWLSGSGTSPTPVAGNTSWTYWLIMLIIAAVLWAIFGVHKAPENGYSWVGAIVRVAIIAFVMIAIHNAYHTVMTRTSEQIEACINESDCRILDPDIPTYGHNKKIKMTSTHIHEDLIFKATGEVMLYGVKTCHYLDIEWSEPGKPPYKWTNKGRQVYVKPSKMGHATTFTVRMKHDSSCE